MIWAYGEWWTLAGGDGHLLHSFLGSFPPHQHWCYVPYHAKAACGVAAGQAWRGYASRKEAKANAPVRNIRTCIACLNRTTSMKDKTRWVYPGEWVFLAKDTTRRSAKKAYLAMDGDGTVAWVNLINATRYRSRSDLWRLVELCEEQGALHGTNIRIVRVAHRG